MNIRRDHLSLSQASDRMLFGPDRESHNPPEAQDLPLSLHDFADTVTAAAPQIDPVFRDRLEERIAGRLANLPQLQPTRGRWVPVTQLARGRYRLGILVALVALLAIAAWPVLGAATLQLVAPREVSVLPADAVLKATPAVAPMRRWLELEELQRQAGFSVLQPTSVPADCSPLERYVLSPGRARVAVLAYACVIIAEQVVRTEQQPYVGPGSVEDVMVGGQPALFVNGGWVKIEGTDSAPQWRPGFSQLFLERGNLFVHLDASGNLAKSEMISIAESLR